MDAKERTWITLEEATAKMLNVNYLPPGSTLPDMMAAFSEVAEADQHNSRIDRVSAEQRRFLQRRVEVCNARSQLAELVLAAMADELLKGDDCELDVENEGVAPRVSLESVSRWAFDKFYIAIPSGPEDTVDADWSEVTVKLLANFRLSFSVKDGPHKTVRFEDGDLMGKKRRIPNQVGGVLIKMAMSKGRRYPEAKIMALHKTKMWRLRKALRTLFGARGEPFYSDGPDGWRPTFRLIDDRRNADERAKKAGKAVGEDEADTFQEAEARDFADENDAAGQWLKKRGSNL